MFCMYGNDWTYPSIGVDPSGQAGVLLGSMARKGLSDARISGNLAEESSRVVAAA